VGTLRVDPDSLIAAGTLADRQRAHIVAVRSYIQTACNQTGAFTGVMDLFQSTYESAVTTATTGMDDSKAVATRAERAFRLGARVYRQADRDMFEQLESVLGEIGRLGQYTPAGSGNTEPGGPILPPLTPTDTSEEDPLDDETVPEWVKELGGDAADSAAADSDAPDTPPWMDPSGTVKDEVRDAVLGNLRRQEYFSLRDQGHTHREAMDLLFPSAHDRADGAIDARNRAEADRNWDDVYRQRRDAGDSESDARDAADRARDTTRGYQEGDRDARENVERNVRNGRETYNGVRDAVDGVREAVESGRGIHDNLEDAEEYDDYNDSPQDRSAQEWANR